SPSAPATPPPRTGSARTRPNAAAPPGAPPHPARRPRKHPAAPENSAPPSLLPSRRRRPAGPVLPLLRDQQRLELAGPHFLQQPLQLAPRVVQAGTDGAQRAADDVLDLFVAKAVHVVQHQHRPV